tara:strand:+ start:703 stop:942 length:240 start_codon:yes stop_codon:yes gene_type:complete
MLTIAFLTALIINMPQGETVPAKRFDWNEFHYVDSKPKPKFIKPVFTPGAARLRRPVYVKPVTVFTSDNLTVDCAPKRR